MNKKLLLVWFVIFSVTCFVFSETDKQYAYRPYPVILVHGFSSSPYGTFGLLTDKKDKNDDVDEEDLKISTRIDTSGHDKGHLGWKLMKAFDNEEQGPFFADYFTDSTDNHYDRLIPAEEELSYTEINHTFVEVYCSFSMV